MNIFNPQYFGFAVLGFIGGAVVGFNLSRSLNFFNLLQWGAYSDHTIFLNTFYELLFGLIIGGSFGAGLFLFLFKTNVKLFHLAIGLCLVIFLTSLLTETLDRRIRPPLVRATQYKNLAYIQAAIRKGNDLNVQDINGNTALMEGSLKRNFPIVKALIQSGADVNVVNKSGRTALMYAVQASSFNVDGNFNMDVIKALIEAGADVNIAATTTGNTVIIQELLKFDPNIDIVKALVRAGADVNAVNHQGRSALTIAKDENFTDILRILREADIE